MFIVFLRFAGSRENLPTHMPGHNAWLQRGFDAGVFLLSGSLAERQGGAILAHGLSRAELEARVAEDPFVEHQLVEPEIVEISASRADDRLRFLLDA